MAHGTVYLSNFDDLLINTQIRKLVSLLSALVLVNLTEMTLPGPRRYYLITYGPPSIAVLSRQ